MLVAVAGGALQGLELTYLARKARFEILLLDQNPEAPATGICHRFAGLDLTDHAALTRALDGVELVVPATENPKALASLVEWCETRGVPLAFDPHAFALSSSKTSSDELFRTLGLPAPLPWPEGDGPVLVKPDRWSGSRGVEVFPNGDAAGARFGGEVPQEWVVQEFLEGPAYSIEVVGRPGAYLPLQVTALEMDRDFSCKRVLAPSGLSPELTADFTSMAVTLAEAVELSGIMDVEAILHEGRLKVLEIDARFPSQTPMAVYHSTGLNMMELLARLFLASPERPFPPRLPRPREAAVILEHIRVRPGEITICGEHAMTGGGPLHLEEGFSGAHEALTDYAPGREEWVATLVFRGRDPAEARGRRDGAMEELRARFGIDSVLDQSPVWSGGGSR